MKTFYNQRLLSTAFIFFLIIGFTLNSHATIHIINTSSFVFTPASTVVNLGDTITWVRINGSHTTTSLTIPAGAAAWDAPLNLNNLSFTYVPAVIGTYNYKCTPHQFTKGMVGDFTVICPTSTVSISAGGPTTFCKPTSVTLSVSGSSGGPLTSFQWKMNNVDIGGATNSSFIATISGDYNLTATNSCGNSATSNTISVTANVKPGANFTQGPCIGGAILLTRTGSPGTGVTFKWKLNGANIPGATNSTFSATVTGNYQVLVTITATGCKKTSQPQTVTINCKLGETNSEITAYPNPSLSSFVLNTSSPDLQNGFIEIYDLTGKLMEHTVITNETTEVGRNLPPGVYFAKVEMAGKMKQILKLMKVE